MTNDSLGKQIARLQSLRELVAETQQAVDMLELEAIGQLERSGQTRYEDSRLTATIPSRRKDDIGVLLPRKNSLTIEMKRQEQPL